MVVVVVVIVVIIENPKIRLKISVNLQITKFPKIHNHVTAIFPTFLGKYIYKFVSTFDAIAKMCQDMLF